MMNQPARQSWEESKDKKSEGASGNWQDERRAKTQERTPKIDNASGVKLQHRFRQTANVRIDNLRQAEPKKGNQFFHTPLLTPITFVSKDANVKADYQMEDEYEAIKKKFPF